MPDYDHCAACGSTRVGREGECFLFWLMTCLLLGATLAFRSKKWKCLDCGRLLEPGAT